jgi:hypothetical protein
LHHDRQQNVTLSGGKKTPDKRRVNLRERSKYNKRLNTIMKWVKFRYDQLFRYLDEKCRKTLKRLIPADSRKIQ